MKPTIRIATATVTVERERYLPDGSLTDIYGVTLECKGVVRITDDMTELMHLEEPDERDLWPGEIALIEDALVCAAERDEKAERHAQELVSECLAIAKGAMGVGHA